MCITAPVFIKIRQMIVDVRRFNGFQNGGRPPSWVFQKFKAPSRQLSVTHNATVSCTNATLRFTVESRKNLQISQIRPYFKAIPGWVQVMPGDAIPDRNRVVAGYPSHLYSESIFHHQSQQGIYNIRHHTLTR